MVHVLLSEGFRVETVGNLEPHCMCEYIYMVLKSATSDHKRYDLEPWNVHIILPIQSVVWYTWNNFSKINKTNKKIILLVGLKTFQYPLTAPVRVMVKIQNKQAIISEFNSEYSDNLDWCLCWLNSIYLHSHKMVDWKVHKLTKIL